MISMQNKKYCYPNSDVLIRSLANAMLTRMEFNKENKI